MKSNEVLLFPHSCLSTARGARLRPRFQAVAMGLPWYLDLEEPASGGAPDLALRLLRPPHSLDPGQAFPRHLAEYLEWMRLHKDRRSGGFRGGMPPQADEPHRWELRQAIRTAGAAPKEAGDEGETFRWHLLLHLFYRAERDALAAEEILARAKTGASPLQAALGPEEAGVSILGDLPVTPEPVLSEWTDIQGLLEAWAGLFGSQEPRLPLLTFNRRIWDWLTEQGAATDPEASLPAPEPGMRRLVLPPAKDPGCAACGLLAGKLAGRTILFLEA